MLICGEKNVRKEKIAIMKKKMFILSRLVARKFAVTWKMLGSSDVKHLVYSEVNSLTYFT